LVEIIEFLLLHIVERYYSFI